jgi:hypothetical protein
MTTLNERIKFLYHLLQDTKQYVDTEHEQDDVHSKVRRARMLV